jgi:hypothetical protein
MLSTVCSRDVIGVDLRLSAFMHSAFVLFACFPKLSIFLGMKFEISLRDKKPTALGDGDRTYAIYFCVAF